MKFNFGIPKRTHQIIVRSLYSKEPDTKSFSIHAKGYTSKDIVDLIKKFFKDNYDSLFGGNIEIDIPKVKNSTHTIIVMPFNNHERTTKSFSIKQSMYSSEEIAKIIADYLCGDNNPFKN